MLIIGSAAAKAWDNNFRSPKDFDAITTYQEFQFIVHQYKSRRVLRSVYPISGSKMVIKLVPDSDHPIQEYEIAYPGTSAEALLGTQDWLNRYARINELLMIKLSHRYKKNSPHFLKTMRDIQYFRSRGAELTPELQVILKAREAETYTYAHPKLSQAKDEFFVKSESFYVYDHDDIHKAVTLLDKPAYLHFKPEDLEVMVSKKMWDACPEHIKLSAGLEEATVLALERSLISLPGVLTPKQAFDKALEKVCTSITSGWFREYCWEHYDQIQSMYSDDYWPRFQAAVAAGKVKAFSP